MIEFLSREYDQEKYTVFWKSTSTEFFFQHNENDIIW